MTSPHLYNTIITAKPSNLISKFNDSLATKKTENFKRNLVNSLSASFHSTIPKDSTAAVNGFNSTMLEKGFSSTTFLQDSQSNGKLNENTLEYTKTYYDKSFGYKSQPMSPKQQMNGVFDFSNFNVEEPKSPRSIAKLIKLIKSNAVKIINKNHQCNKIQNLLVKETSITSTIKELQGLVQQINTVTFEIEVYKNILKTIEEVFEYYKTFLENKIQELLEKYKSNDKDSRCIKFYKICTIYENEVLKLKSMYLSYLQKLLNENRNSHTNTSTFQNLDFFRKCQILFGSLKTMLTTSEKSRSCLVEEKIKIKFANLNVLNALLMFITDCVQPNPKLRIVFPTGRKLYH